MSLAHHESPAATGQPGGGVAQWLVVGLILLFECCALVTVVSILGLLGHYYLVSGHATQPFTTQAARGLQYWATLLYVHAIALAWFRREKCTRAALFGFAGIVCLGCGCVFSLTIASVGDLAQWPEELKIVVWNVVLPIVAWLSGLGGCFLLLVSLTARRQRAAQAQEAIAAPAEIRSCFRTADPSPPTPLPQGERGVAERLLSPDLTCRAFAPLVVVTLVLAAVATGLVAFWAEPPLAAMYSRRAGDRSVDLLGVCAYAFAYLAVSLVVLAAAWVCGRRALRTGDADLLWRAGVLAVAGGLQHPLLLGWPAVVAGILATKAANRGSRGALRSLLASMGHGRSRGTRA